MSDARLDDQVRDAIGRLSVPTPDSPIRRKGWWQIYVRLARPTLDWVGVVGAVWALFLGDALGNPMDEGVRLIVLGFVAGLHGIRTFEKTKGVA
jgi:hypothetical protein